MILGALIFVPAAVGGAALFSRNARAQLIALLTVAVLHLAATASLWISPAQPVGRFLALDALGLLFLTLTSGLFFAASLYSVAYLRGETHDEPAALHRFVPFLLLFLASMTVVVATQHLALMWAAVEATTLASAPLIYFYRRRPALEAAWKYLLICSVGIALALLGVFFLGISASAAKEIPTLDLSALTRAGRELAHPWLRAAFVLALVGYGTKMGLAPMHTWLPDAHSQAPSPVSALLSGALLNCAFLGILRFYQVCAAAGEARFAQTLLLTLGLVSLAVAAAFIVGQKDYKRLLAYSSVENMGVMATGVGLGGAATYGAMLHAVNHSFAKASLFFLAGNVLRAYGSTRASDVKGAVHRLPLSATLLLAAFLAIGGSPPFGAFMSEFLIFRWALATHLGLAVLFAVLLAVAFLGMAGVLLPMAQGAPPKEAKPASEPILSVLPPAALVAGVLVLGLYVPPFLSRLLRDASALIGG